MLRCTAVPTWWIITALISEPADRTNFNLSIEKSYFNERLTFIVGGAVDFGLNTVQQNQSSAFPFLPDVTAEWRLTPDGKFRLTFFYRENILTSEAVRGKQNRSGTSISFRKEFDTIDELFRRIKRKGSGVTSDGINRKVIVMLPFEMQWRHPTRMNPFKRYVAIITLESRAPSYLSWLTNIFRYAG